MGLGFIGNDRPPKKDEPKGPGHRTYIRCPTCSRTFYYDKINEKTRGKTCKCGNLWVGTWKPQDVKGSKHKFYVGIRYKDVRPEIGEKKIKRYKKKKERGQ